MSSTVEGSFDPGTLHRLIEFKDKQRGKKLSLRVGAHTVEMILAETQKQLSTPDFDNERYQCTFCSVSGKNKVCDECVEEYRRT